MNKKGKPFIPLSYVFESQKMRKEFLKAIKSKGMKKDYNLLIEGKVCDRGISADICESLFDHGWRSAIKDGRLRNETEIKEVEYTRHFNDGKESVTFRARVSENPKKTVYNVWHQGNKAIEDLRRHYALSKQENRLLIEKRRARGWQKDYQKDLRGVLREMKKCKSTSQKKKLKKKARELQGRIKRKQKRIELYERWYERVHKHKKKLEAKIKKLT